MRFTPRSNEFYPLFSEFGDLLREGARLLVELLAADADGRERIAERMKQIEHAADETTHTIFKKANATFVTPFDREDIYRLGASLDDVMDQMEESADLIVLYGLTDFPPEFGDIVEVLTQAADITATALTRLRTMNDLAEYWIEINRLENLADRSHRQLLARLFSGEFDAMEVLKVKDVAEALESAADAFEKVANTVESISVKES